MDEDSLSESDFSDFSSDVSSLEEEGSHRHSTNDISYRDARQLKKGCRIKAYWLQKDPIREVGLAECSFVLKPHHAAKIFSCSHSSKISFL